MFERIWNVAEPHWTNFKAIMGKYAVTDKIMTAWTTARNFFSNIRNSALPHWNAFINKIRSLSILNSLEISGLAIEAGTLGGALWLLSKVGTVHKPPNILLNFEFLHSLM
jgi:hypothetical protein